VNEVPETVLTGYSAAEPRRRGNFVVANASSMSTIVGGVFPVIETGRF
jgi:hypothetical protein